MSFGRKLVKLGLAAVASLYFWSATPSDIPNNAQAATVVQNAASKKKYYQVDEKSGLEVRVFNADSNKISLYVRDTAGEKKGVEEIILYQDGKELKRRRNCNLLIAQATDKKSHEYHAQIKDKEGNVLITKKLAVKNEPLNLEEIFKMSDDEEGPAEKGLSDVAEHNLKKGYSPNMGDIGRLAPYNKKALKIKFKDSTIYVPAFKDRRVNCAKCHSEEKLTNSITQRIAGISSEIEKVWGSKINALPKDLVFNPAPLSKMSKEDLAMLKQIYKNDPKVMESFIKYSEKNAIGGYVLDITGIGVFKLTTNDLDTTILHECTHSLQSKMLKKLSPSGKKHISYSHIVSEPFAYFMNVLYDDSHFYLWFLDQQTTEKDYAASQTEFVFELQRTYAKYFDPESISDMEALDKENPKSIDKKLIEMMRYAFNGYNENMLALDTLAIEAQSHEFPIEALIAAKFEPAVSGTSEKRLAAGIKKCNEYWDRYSMSAKDLTRQHLNVLEDSYIAGGGSDDKTRISNINDLEHVIKRNLGDEGFSKQEVLQVYHTFLRQKFSDCKGNFNYEPDPEKQLLVLDQKMRRLWRKYCVVYRAEEPMDLKIRNYFYQMAEGMKKSSVSEEVDALCYEKERLLKLVPHSILKSE
jgi:hypothetical protein